MLIFLIWLAGALIAADFYVLVRARARSQSGKNRRGMQPEGGCPSEARSRDR